MCVRCQADRLVQLGVALKGSDIQTDIPGTDTTTEDGMTDAKLAATAEQLGDTLKVKLDLDGLQFPDLFPEDMLFASNLKGESL